MDIRVLLLCLILVVPSLGDFLYYSSPGGAFNSEKNGVWGGPIEATERGKAKNLTYAGYRCFSGQDGLTSLIVREMSFDQISGNVLIRHDETKPNAVTLVKTTLCQPFQKCTTQGYKFLFNRCVISGVGPIAYHDEVLYFIFDDIVIDEGREFHRIELRKMDKCQDKIPFEQSDTFLIKDCTTKLAEIRNHDDIRNVHKTLEYTPQNTLFPIQQADNSLAFLTVMGRLYREDEIANAYEMSLMYLNDAGDVKILHSMNVSLALKEYTLKELGGVSYRNGKVCWTAMEFAFCGDLDLEAQEVKNVKEWVSQERTKEVCKDSRGIFDTVLTGIAITESETLSFYFGCHSNNRNEGGAGLLSTLSDGVDAEVLPVLSGDKPINAGSMFLTDRCEAKVGEDGKVEVIMKASTSGAQRLVTPGGLLIGLFIVVWMTL